MGSIIVMYNGDGGKEVCDYVIDKDILDYIIEINRFEGVRTIHSCMGHSESKVRNHTYVLMSIKDKASAREFLELVAGYSQLSVSFWKEEFLGCYMLKNFDERVEGKKIIEEFDNRARPLRKAHVVVWLDEDAVETFHWFFKTVIGCMEKSLKRTRSSEDVFSELRRKRVVDVSQGGFVLESKKAYNLFGNVVSALYGIGIEFMLLFSFCLLMEEEMKVLIFCLVLSVVAVIVAGMFDVFLGQLYNRDYHNTFCQNCEDKRECLLGED